jgi:hypothetical protein
MIRARIYIDPRDWWVGVYIQDRHTVYICLAPCVVIKVVRVVRVVQGPRRERP